jgi:hypothetical protein
MDTRKQLIQEPPKRRVQITQPLLNQLTEEGLAQWFHTSGNVCSKRAPTMVDPHKEYTLSTQSFSLEENKLIRMHLFRKFGIKTTILRQHRLGGKSNAWDYYLYFASATRDKIVAVIQKYPAVAADCEVIRSSETIREAPTSVG